MLESHDLDAAVAFYEQKLGFSCTHRMGAEWVRLARDQVAIMFTRRFSQRTSPQPVMTGGLYLYTDAVDAWWADMNEKKVPICYEIETFEYGMREFAIYDCHGYMLQIGQEVGEAP